MKCWYRGGTWDTRKGVIKERTLFFSFVPLASECLYLLGTVWDGMGYFRWSGGVVYLDASQGNEDSVTGGTREVADTLDGAVVASMRLIKLNTTPNTGSKLWTTIIPAEREGERERERERGGEEGGSVTYSLR